MKVVPAFDPIEVGEIDSFAFDFTQDVGAEDIVSVAWSCRLWPYSTGVDPAPQKRVPAGLQSPQHSLSRRDANGNLVNVTGFFAIAAVGPMPVSAAGATYILEATAYLSGGVRQLKLNALLPCVLPGH